MDEAKLYRIMYTVRYFEESLLQLFSRGKLNGTTHAYIGQEANAVGLLSQLKLSDIVWSNHRCHGHYITFTDDPEGLIMELVGAPGGTCGGRGGSQHLCKGNFYSNGIQGSIVPVATGMALAEKLRKSNAITAVFLGDGTLGEGVVYEAFNMASLWKLPVVFVVENNYYAQSTPSHLQLAGSIANRGKAFGMEVFEVSSNDLSLTYTASQETLEYVRAKGNPAMLIMNTYRTCPHSKGDDFRNRSEIEDWKQRDPLTYSKARLEAAVVENIEKQVAERIDRAFSMAIEASEGLGGAR